MLARLTLDPTEQTYLFRTLVIITFLVRLQLKCLFSSLGIEAVQMFPNVKTRQVKTRLVDL